MKHAIDGVVPLLQETGLTAACKVRDLLSGLYKHGIEAIRSFSASTMLQFEGLGTAPLTHGH